MRALISVSEKSGLIDFAKELNNLDVEIVSFGGTYKKLREEGIIATQEAGFCAFPEFLNGEVKDLDIVAVNLLPFSEIDDVEQIDVGGAAALRAAVKNYKKVIPIVDTDDYEIVISQLKKHNEIEEGIRYMLMHKAIMHTANYDAMMAEFIGKTVDETYFPDKLTFTYEKVQDLRYGENPHQHAAFYKQPWENAGSITEAYQLNGKELSFNNINDTDNALELLKEYEEPTVVLSKHGIPCGVASADDINVAWEKAYSADMMSLYGGSVVVNRMLTKHMAMELKEIFLEVVVAPKYEKGVLEILEPKKNLRILELASITEKQGAFTYDLRKINGGLIIQTVDHCLLPENGWRVVSKAKPTKGQEEDLIFALKMVKHVKTNGIIIAKDKQSVGIGPGQINRIWATKQAMVHAHELISKEATHGAVMAADAYIPFTDTIETAHQEGITAVIEPGGSMRDQEIIDKCDEFGMVLIFTDMRHFKY